MKTRLAARTRTITPSVSAVAAPNGLTDQRLRSRNRGGQDEDVRALQGDSAAAQRERNLRQTPHCRSGASGRIRRQMATTKDQSPAHAAISSERRPPADLQFESQIGVDDRSAVTLRHDAPVRAQGPCAQTDRLCAAKISVIQSWVCPRVSGVIWFIPAGRWRRLELSRSSASCRLALAWPPSLPFRTSRA